MDLWQVVNIIAIPSFIFTIIALLFAINQGKKAKKAEKEIAELKQAMTSYAYLKELGFNYYKNGKYDESLDVFKKFLLENNKQNEWNEIINTIMRKETEKIFSNFLIFSNDRFPKFSLLVQTFISYEESFVNTHYPEIIKTFINDYTIKFKCRRYKSEFLIALLDKNWQKAKEIMEETSVNNEEGIDNIFKSYVINYIATKYDDIPF